MNESGKVRRFKGMLASSETTPNPQDIAHPEFSGTDLGREGRLCRRLSRKHPDEPVLGHYLHWVSFV